MNGVRRALLLLLFFVGWTSVQALTSIPPLTDPVMDTAGLLSPQTEAYLNQQLRELHHAGGSQIAILTVPQLEDETIEQLGIRAAEQWKPGSAEQDKGVILVIAKQDRKVRIEVGQGLEGVLTDVYSSRIIREKMTPLFRDGDYDAGVISGIAHIIASTDPDHKLTGEQQPRRVRRSSSGGGGFGILPMLVLFLIVIVISALNGGGPRGRGRGGFGGGGFGGGWGGGSGGGGGGFGGGGGGFSGGGASGSW